ncbi:MAG: hypothetical protein ACOC22_00095 [bacterium]
MSENLDKQELDSYHYHEMIDRLYLMGDMIDSFLSNHPVAVHHSKINELITNASKDLAEAYQIAGMLK